MQGATAGASSNVSIPLEAGQKDVNVPNLDKYKSIAASYTKNFKHITPDQVYEEEEPLQDNRLKKEYSTASILRNARSEQHMLRVEDFLI